MNHSVWYKGHQRQTCLTPLLLTVKVPIKKQATALNTSQILGWEWFWKNHFKNISFSIQWCLSVAFHSFELFHKIKRPKNSEKLPNVLFYTHNLQDRWAVFLYNEFSTEEYYITSLKNPLWCSTTFTFLYNINWHCCGRSVFLWSGQYMVTFSLYQLVIYFKTMSTNIEQNYLS